MKNKPSITALILPVILSFIVVLYLIFMNQFDHVLSSVSVEDKWGRSSPTDAGVDEGAAEVWFQLESVDPELQRAQVTTYLWPSSDIAKPHASSTITDVPLRMFIDEIGGSGIYNYESGDRVGGIKSEIDMVNPLGLKRSLDSWYPFDQYSMSMFVNVERGGIQTGEFVPLKVFDFFYTTPTPGFRVKYSRVSYDDTLDIPIFDEKEVFSLREQGRLSVVAKIDRTLAVRLITLIVSIFSVLLAVSLVGMTLQVFRHRRPPSVQTLVWGAATVLALVQMRELFPGRPRVGIVLDFFVFFPALVASLISVFLLAIMWETRDDWAI